MELIASKARSQTLSVKVEELNAQLASQTTSLHTEVALRAQHETESAALLNKVKTLQDQVASKEAELQSLVSSSNEQHQQIRCESAAMVEDLKAAHVLQLVASEEKSRALESERQKVLEEEQLRRKKAEVEVMEALKKRETEWEEEKQTLHCSHTEVLHQSVARVEEAVTKKAEVRVATVVAEKKREVAVLEQQIKGMQETNEKSAITVKVYMLFFIFSTSPLS